jgi:hypothetical protein
MGPSSLAGRTGADAVSIGEIGITGVREPEEERRRLHAAPAPRRRRRGKCGYVRPNDNGCMLPSGHDDCHMCPCGENWWEWRHF